MLLLMVGLTGATQRTAENGSIHLTYNGWEKGFYRVTLVNKTTCTLSVKLDWEKGDSTVSITQSLTLDLPALYKGGSRIRAKVKDGGNCCKESGWVAVVVGDYGSLPYRVKELAAHKYFDRIKIDYSLELDYGEWAYLQKSIDGGRSWKNALSLSNSSFFRETFSTPFEDREPALRNLYRFMLQGNKSISYSKTVYVIYRKGPDTVLIKNSSGQVVKTGVVSSFRELLHLFKQLPRAVYIVEQNGRTERMLNF